MDIHHRINSSTQEFHHYQEEDLTQIQTVKEDILDLLDKYLDHNIRMISKLIQINLDLMEAVTLGHLLVTVPKVESLNHLQDIILDNSSQATHLNIKMVTIVELLVTILNSPVAKIIEDKIKNNITNEKLIENYTRFIFLK